MYYNPIVDPHGFTHSVDMVTVEYMLAVSYPVATDKLMNLLSGFGFDADKGSKLGVTPSFRYGYYTNHVWHDGIVFSLGKWSNYDKLEKKWWSLDMLMIKVNPNKHAGTALLDAVLSFLQEHCRDGYLVRYDYAIDVPCALSDVMVIGSRKEKGLYKGTRYYGQRHKHGYLKVYDKAKEQNFDYLLSRLEFTFNPRDIPSWENIVIRAPETSQNAPERLSSTCKLYLDMLMELKALGADIEPYIEQMNYRTWKQIEPYLFSGIQLQLDQTILDKLIDKINCMFIISDTNNNVNGEFMSCFDTDLPFD